MASTEIKAEIKKYETRLNEAVSPNKDKNALNYTPLELAFIEKKLAKLKADLVVAEEAGKKEPEKKEPEKKVVTVKKAEPVKHKVEATKKELKTIKVGDRIVSEKDKDFCVVLLKAWNERVAAREKSQRKYKTTSVSSKIGKDSAHAIIKAIGEVSADKIGHNPKGFIHLVEKSEKVRLEYISTLEDIVKFGGGHLNKTEIKAEMDTVNEMLIKIKQKFITKK